VHPGDDMSVAAHCSRLLPPLQMHRVKSAQLAPIAWIAPAQFVAMQLLHASFACCGSALPKHPTMSTCAACPDCAGCEVGAAPSCGPLEAALLGEDGEEAAGGGSDPHAIVHPVARTKKTVARFPMRTPCAVRDDTRRG
jgi:hypothetical protein